MGFLSALNSRSSSKLLWKAAVFSTVVVVKHDCLRVVLSFSSSLNNKGRGDALVTALASGHQQLGQYARCKNRSKCNYLFLPFFPNICIFLWVSLEHCVKKILLKFSLFIGTSSVTLETFGDSFLPLENSFRLFQIILHCKYP